jgi:MFS family permease
MAVVLALAGVTFGDPAHWLGYTVAFSLALGVAGATQGVTIDGWRITAVPVDKQSVMTAISEMGYRVGALAAGAGALLLADRYGWRSAYLCMAALMSRCDLRFRCARARVRLHRESSASGFCRRGRRADQGNGDAAGATGPSNPPHDRWLSNARLYLERHGLAVVQKPALFRH